MSYNKAGYIKPTKNELKKYYSRIEKFIKEGKSESEAKRLASIIKKNKTRKIKQEKIREPRFVTNHWAKGLDSIEKLRSGNIKIEKKASWS